MTQFTVTLETLPDRMDQLREELLRRRVNRKDTIRYALAVEEIIELFLQKSEDGQVAVRLHTFLGTVSVRLAFRGEQISAPELAQRYLGLEDGEDEDCNTVIRQLMQKVIGDDLTLRYVRGRNICNIVAARPRYASLIYTLLALACGIGFGFLLKAFVPAAVSSFISDNILDTISTVFMNAIKMIVGPLVFFSMAASIGDYGDLRVLGRMAGKIIAGFLITSFLAVGVGYATYQIFPIGSPQLRNAITTAAASTIESSANVSVTLKDTIVNIIPSSFAEAFVNNDMLQLIFLGILLGIAVGALSQAWPGAKSALSCINAVFSRMTTIIIRFMPAAVFCSMAKMVLTIDAASMLQVAVWIPVSYLAYFLMLVLYCILIVVFGRLNPLHFWRGIMPALLTTFSLASGSAAMPATLQCCEKLGISKRVYSFSIPLGTAINKDGSCIALVVSTMFMAKIFGVPVVGGKLFTMVISAVLLSVGTPSVPNGGLLCTALLLTQLGIPAESISLIMGIYMLCSMAQSTVNTAGDAVLSVIAARSEKLLDMERYRSN